MLNSANVYMADIQGLSYHGDALVLLLFLRHEYGENAGEFKVPKPFANRLRWDERRFRLARQVLVDRGYIELVHEGGSYPGDCHRYVWTNRGAPSLTTVSTQEAG